MLQFSSYKWYFSILSLSAVSLKESSQILNSISKLRLLIFFKKSFVVNIFLFLFKTPEVYRHCFFLKTGSYNFITYEDWWMLT